MFDSKLNHKLSLTAALLGSLTVAACAEQPATVANSQPAQAAGQATGSAATATPGGPAADAHATQPLHLVTLPKGTKITATVRQTLATDKNHWGDPFAASIVRPVKVDGKTVLPRGTQVTGSVYEVKKHELKVVLDSVVINGVYCDLSTHSRRPSDKDQPKGAGQKQKKDNSVLSARTRLTFKLSKAASIPVKA